MKSSELLVSVKDLGHEGATDGKNGFLFFVTTKKDPEKILWSREIRINLLYQNIMDQWKKIEPEVIKDLGIEKD